MADQITQEGSMAKKVARTFKDSPLMKVLKETSQDSTLRQQLLRRIEKELSAKVVTFFTSFSDPQAQVSDDDAEMLESLLSVESIGNRKLILIINSPGGQALAAERIVNVCREYSDGQFEALVPHMAKSAATMICFGANCIHMSPTAELGPVDPQVPYWPGEYDSERPPRWISAEEYVRSYDALMADASGGKVKRIEPYLQQLNRYDARYIEQLRSAQQLSRDISVGLLKSSMMKDKNDDEIRDAIKVFLTQEATRSHGRMINADGAAACGLKVNKIPLHSDVWHRIWELYVRADWAVTHRNRKIMETVDAAAIQ